MDTKEIEVLNTNFRQLQLQKETLLLSTMGTDYPEISYAPFVRDSDGCFYVFISQLAAHTRNLMSNPRASVMFISNEEESQNLFARERVIYKCDSNEVTMDSECYVTTLELMEKQFGNVVGMLRSLPDFHLVRLKPCEGRYVVGFGKAFTVDLSSGQLIHITEEQVRADRK